MRRNRLDDIVDRARSWPGWAQEELLRLVDEIERETGSAYGATNEELAGIDRGLEAARSGDFASEEAVRAVLARHRNG